MKEGKFLKGAKPEWTYFLVIALATCLVIPVLAFQPDSGSPDVSPSVVDPGPQTPNAASMAAAAAAAQTTTPPLNCSTASFPDLNGKMVLENGVVRPAVPAFSNQPALGLANLPQDQQEFFCASMFRFQEVDSVSGVLNPANANSTNCTAKDKSGSSTSGQISCAENGLGLGPRFNGNSCAQCHSNPTVLGSSSSVNPQIALAHLDGATNTIPSFITTNGPVREARFIDTPGSVGTSTPVLDGNVHPLFTITGRVDATNAVNISGISGTTCSISQPNFAAALLANNVIFRIPIDVRGDGLVELIPDDTFEKIVAALASQRGELGISGSFNRSPNDATIMKEGWKAQNKGDFLFAGEAYNVEQGVTNEMFPNERQLDDDQLNETNTDVTCEFNPLPEDTMGTFQHPVAVDVPGDPQVSVATNIPESDLISDLVNFVEAIRLSAPPTQLPNQFGSGNFALGKQVFDSIGCNGCHSDSTMLVTIGSIGNTTSLPANQGNQLVQVFSDMQIHDMGTGLADGITQASADGNHFRTAPLWGLSSRLFFLHDGRTNNIVQAILDHQSSGSEANTVINNFKLQSPSNQQALLDFLRSL